MANAPTPLSARAAPPSISPDEIAALFTLSSTGRRSPRRFTLKVARRGGLISLWSRLSVSLYGQTLGSGAAPCLLPSRRSDASGVKALNVAMRRQLERKAEAEQSASGPAAASERSA